MAANCQKVVKMPGKDDVLTIGCKLPEGRQNAWQSRIDYWLQTARRLPKCLAKT
jgi:hypothetical protein